MCFKFKEVIFGKDVEIEIFCEENCDICYGFGVKLGIIFEKCSYCGGKGFINVE